MTSTNVVPIEAAKPGIMARVGDSFFNFAAKLGFGNANLFSQSRYQFDFLTRNRTELEAMYRTSWIIGAAVDYPADDMTRAGIEIESTLPPEEIDTMTAAMRDLGIWHSFGQTIKWARLFGGSVAVMMIDGQDPATPLRPETIGPGAFKGLLVLDRWMVNPSLGNLVTEPGPHLGLPKFYSVVADAMALPGMTIHYSRVLRFEGIGLPYYQRLYENLWGESVIERIHDRLVAFDSTSQGAAQLVYKAHLRIMKIKNYREIVAAGGKALQGLTAQIGLMRLYQSSEGISLLDAEDEFEVQQYTFAGLDNILLQFGQQLAGALEMPLVRLFGQPPAGLNSSGESDLTTYYDGVEKKQETDMRGPVTTVLDVLSWSIRGGPLPRGFTYKFKPLWTIKPKEKADIAESNSRAIAATYEAGIVSLSTALKELRQSSRVSGMWSNITDADIKDAESAPPPAELAQQAHELSQQLGEDDDEGGDEGSGDAPEPTGDSNTGALGNGGPPEIFDLTNAGPLAASVVR